ncbi:uncharacterized protein ACNLHF_000483 [Anomaloglossus baeobatrachus]|uniref:uncharacterized protein LOC142311282 n=1 Tax=Anomaloglossus baeobatrachus TaxID=238106 RepID=UPI003F500D9F
MSSEDSPPERHQRMEEEAAAEAGAPEAGQGGENSGEGSQDVALPVRHRVPPRGSRGRRGRGGGRRHVSQRQQDEESDGGGRGIDVELLINLVHERQPLWDMQDHRHADSVITRRLWEEVASEVEDGWENLNERAKSKTVRRLIIRWRSLRDRFRRDYNLEMEAPSGSAGRKGSQYRYARALAFLRSTMLPRRTFTNTLEPASGQHPPGAIPQVTVTGDPLQHVW